MTTATNIATICETDLEDLHVGSKRVCLLYLCLVYSEFKDRTDFIVNNRTGDLRTGKEVCDTLNKTFKDELTHLNIDKIKSITTLLQKQHDLMMPSVENQQKKSNERRKLLAKIKTYTLPQFRLYIVKNYKNIPIFAFVDYEGKARSVSDSIDIILFTSELKPNWWVSNGKRLLSIGVKTGVFLLTGVVLGGLVASSGSGSGSNSKSGSSNKSGSNSKSGSDSDLINIAVGVFQKCGVPLDPSQINNKSYINAKYREASKTTHPDKGENSSKRFRALVIAKDFLQGRGTSEWDKNELRGLYNDI